MGDVRAGRSRRWYLASALVACSLWGVSSVAAQEVFDSYSFSPLTLVAIRMPIAGLILLILFRSLPPYAKVRTFVLFSVVGLWLVQTSYFLSIATSNAATATLLQFLTLPMIAAYQIGASKQKATFAGITAVVMASVGTAELVAGGPNGSLSLIVTPVAVIAGLLSAVAAAYYTIQSKPLITLYGSTRITTWGLLIGSIVAVPTGFLPYPRTASAVPPGGTLELVALIAFVVVGGTLLTFLLYFKGLERITPTEAGITAAMEPIVAAVVSFLVLHVVLTTFQYVGGLLIITAVTITAIRSGRGGG